MAPHSCLRDLASDHILLWDKLDLPLGLSLLIHIMGSQWQPLRTQSHSMQHTAGFAGVPTPTPTRVLVLSPQNIPLTSAQLSPGSISSPQQPCVSQADAVPCRPEMPSMEPSLITRGARILAQPCPWQCCPSGTSAPRGTPTAQTHPLCRRGCRMEEPLD